MVHWQTEKLKAYTFMTRNRILKLIHKPILVLNGFLWLGLRYCILHPLLLSDVRLCLRLRLTSSQPGPTWIRQIREEKAANEAPRGSSRRFFQARASAPLRLPCPASIFCPASLFWGKASPRLGDWCPMWDSHTQKYPMCGPHPDSCLGFGPQKYPAQLERARLVKWFWATKMGAFFFEGFSAT